MLLTEKQYKDLSKDLKSAQKAYRNDLVQNLAPELSGGRAVAYEEILKMNLKGETLEDFDKKHQYYQKLHKEQPSALWHGILEVYDAVQEVVQA